MLPIARVSALRALRTTATTSTSLFHPPTASLLRLLSTLAVLEQKDGKLIGGSLCAVTAGKKLGGSVTGFVAGSNIQRVADQAAEGYGMEHVVMVDNEAYDKVRNQLSIKTLVLFRVLTSHRVCQRTSLHCWWRTSRKEDTPTSLRATRHLERVFSPEWPRC
jgi:Electron transfer flavoprotein domain